MIPIRDTTPSKTYPVVNSLLIGFNVLVFLLQSASKAHPERFFYIYGMVPARYTVPEIADYFPISRQLFSLVSFMFLHGGFWHLLGNMWTLYIFGDNVEDRLGHVRYLVFYLVCGVVSGLVHFLSNVYSNVPIVGASGAIAGVMGAYFLLYPTSRILTLIPILIFPLFVEIPAFVFLGLWFLLQFLSATGGGTATGIAWWAHIGGFLCGMALLQVFRTVPKTGITERLKPITERKSSPRLQVIRPVGRPDDLNLYGTLRVTPREAAYGARKLVNIPWGFHDRMFQVRVPPGIQEGTNLRLAGIGKRDPEGARGDVVLRVHFSEEAPSGSS
jgi:hypothetical protein